eukprot:TRINITY_DN19819_c0_g2_i1.p1 TRINITY_DN19819_c0_g2~~TRINITY_DN19819_c0_g2_i1.p1  ORF type:complete len:163 (+),score=23.97 TRINITY_DN19819_c0_g2_i1:319-807(+)
MSRRSATWLRPPQGACGAGGDACAFLLFIIRGRRPWEIFAFRRSMKASMSLPVLQEIAQSAAAGHLIEASSSTRSNLLTTSRARSAPHVVRASSKKPLLFEAQPIVFALLFLVHDSVQVVTMILIREPVLSLLIPDLVLPLAQRSILRLCGAAGFTVGGRTS